MPRNNAGSRALAGTNLYRDPRTGCYLWRRVDKISGRRVKRSTGTTHLAKALREVERFEEELNRREAGLPDLASWKQELLPLVETYLASLDGDLTATYAPRKRIRILRALTDLGLKTAADLDQVARVHDRLMALEKTGVRRYTLRRCYQSELRQFSAWLADHKRHLDHDPLASWRPIKLTRTRAGPKRRAFLPDEVARALLATDRLGEIHGREHAQRPLFLAALVTGARPGALASREVGDLEPRGSRIVLGADVGKKRRGAGALDPATLAELLEAKGERHEGALFLSPGGEPLDRFRVLDRWREAFGLGLVDALWPEREPRELELAYLVNLALATGRTRVSKGGNPKLLKPETRDKRNELERRVTAIAAEVSPEWCRRMEAVDYYGLRKTHRTWATAKGVPGVAIDLQLGHESPTAGEATAFARLLAGSETGRGSYVDMESALFDASLSAEAVRELLDEALARLTTSTSALVVVGEDRGPQNGPRGALLQFPTGLRRSASQ
jgi:hypothetical protein